MGFAVPRRIIFFCHSQEVGGAELYLERVIRAFGSPARDAGSPWRIELICRPDAALDGWLARFDGDDVGIHRIGLTRPRDIERMRGVLCGADILHINLAFPCGKYQALGVLLGAQTRARLVMTHHLALDGASLAGLGYTPATIALWSRLFPLYARRCHQHIALSRAGGATLEREYGFDPQRLAVIYNGADLDLFAPLAESERQRVKRRIGAELAGVEWGDEIALVCAVGRLNPQKGFDDLVRAAALARAERPNARFVVIGEGELRASLTRQIAEAGLADVFYLAGQRPHAAVAAWLAASELVALPSHYEGFPFAVIEAMACGRPVVATRVSGTAEAVVDGATGWLVPPADPQALAGAILATLRDPRAARAMGAWGRERAVERFDARVNLARTIEVIAGSPKPEPLAGGATPVGARTPPYPPLRGEGRERR